MGTMAASISFHTLSKNCYKMQICNLRLPQSLAHLNDERVTVDSGTKFVVNLRNIQGVMSIYSRKKKIKLLLQLQGKPSTEIT